MRNFVYVVRDIVIMLNEAELERIRDIYKRYRELMRVLKKYYEYARRYEKYCRKYNKEYLGRTPREMLSRATLKRILEKHSELKIPSLTCYDREILANVKAVGKQRHILASWRENKTIYVNRKGELVIRGLGIRRELDYKVLHRIKWLEKRGFRPVVAQIIWRGDRRLLVKVVFRGLSRVPKRDDVVEALERDRLTIISIDVNAIHGIYLGVFRVNRGKLILTKCEKQNIKWVELWQLQGKERKLVGKLDKRWLSREEFIELRTIRKHIKEKLRLNKNLVINKIIEAIDSEKRVGRTVLLALEKCDEKVIERILREYRELPKYQRYCTSLFMRGWMRRVKRVAETYGALFIVVSQYRNSVLCPYCEVEMKRVRNRVMKCPRCDRKWNRDKVALWNVARKVLERVMKRTEEN